jgi:multiple sugar transport system substrate-binding protein
MTPRTTRSTKVRLAAGAALTSLALLTAACGGGGFEDPEAETSQSTGPADLKLLFAGDAVGTKAMTEAGAAWAASSGNKVTVSAATDMNQELSQGFAAGNPPDVFSLDSSVFAGYAKSGDLTPYAEKLSMKDDFNPSLRQSFTYDGTFYCAPKDTSVLGLVINTDIWSKAGLTDADIPTTWDQLAAVSKKLTSGKVKGLVFGDTRDRIGAFMKQSGGWITNPDQTAMTADTPENLAAIEFVQKLLADGSAAYPKQVGAGWGGEAFGKGNAAMTIEGNWIKGAMKADFPDVKYQVAELPAGPAGKGTLAFTQCWGIAAKSQYQQQAQQLVESLMTKETQLSMAKALGVMPSLQSAQADYQAQTPEDKAFVAGLEYAQGPVTAVGMEPVLKDFDTKLQGLPKAEPKAILESLQKNGTSALGG